MKKVICTTYGPPEVLEIIEVDQPTPKANELLVKVIVTSVTSGDARIRGFNVPKSFAPMMRLAVGFRKPRMDILGLDFSGVVTAVGQDVTKFKVGDEVFGASDMKTTTYAEYITIAEDGVVLHKPENVSFEAAAAVNFGAGAALHFLRRGNIQAGQDVLIYGASGAVGTMAVQLAKHYDATVTAVCSTRNIEMVKSIGADHIIDYTADDFTQTDARFDIVFDTIGKISFEQAKRVLKPEGYFLLGNGEMGDIFHAMWTKIASKQKKVSEMAPESLEKLSVMQTLLASGELKPVIDQSFPLDDIVEAHRYVDTGKKQGNVVINVAD